MSKISNRVATAATVLALGGLAGIALSADKKAPSATVAEKPIRTQVVRRTIHVTKHAKPKHPVAAGGPSAAASGTGTSPAYGSSGGSPNYESATTGSSSSGTAPASYEPEPVTTSTSGAGAGAPVPGGYETESEDGGEHEGGGDD